MAWQRKIPFGYGMENGAIVVRDAEATAVKSIYSLYRAGFSYSQIAGEMMRQGVMYHRHTGEWNKHMVKRILENEKYLGTADYPKIIGDEDFLTVRFLRQDKNTYAPYPESVLPLKGKCVCGCCGAGMARDTKQNGRPCWRCENSECGNHLYVEDKHLWEQVTDLLWILARRPHLLAEKEQAPDGHTNIDLLRVINEINHEFNRPEINIELLRMLIFAAASETYAMLPDPTPERKRQQWVERLGSRAVGVDSLRELFGDAVRALRIGENGALSLELTNGEIITENKEEKEQSA